ncbi:MAG: response regulator transcription factor [Chloroflexota bacterium]
MARILVVDDDPNIREFVTLALQSEGHTVDMASNGAVALEVAGAQPPDVILLDMRMPVMDGWQFAAAYRSLPGPQARLVVMSAAHVLERRDGDIEADASLAKPFELDELLSLVERLAVHQ